VRLGAVLAIGIAAGLVTWLAVRSGDSSTTSGSSRGHEQVAAVSATGLRTLSRALGQPIYWAGPVSGDTYELTRAGDGRIYVRYLPPGEKVGTSKALLTVGTYPVAHALSATQGASSRGDSAHVPVGGGGVAFYDRRAPTSVYVAYPGAGYQIEVYDPSAAAARRLVSSGRVTAVEQSGAPALVSLQQLTARAGTAGHPVYWVGAQPATEYELTQTGGRTYVRYLPSGQKAGTKAAFLTIGSYPLAGAFDVTRGLASAPTSVRVYVRHGGVGFYARSRPTNVYVAFPGQNAQIEVYDPSAARARQVVSSGQLGQLSG
jgi:hypothetical protein